MTRLSAQDLSVGYNKKVLIGGICLDIRAGEIVTLIGPNGAGKSTVLKSITRHLDPLGGTVYVDGEDAKNLSFRNFATKFSVVLTERLKTERMTCEEVVAAGRYPYTGFFGRLTQEDREIVAESMALVGAAALADARFDAISDGQRQRVMLARAICQQPQIMVLDEPTSFLDIRYKIELLGVLRRLATQKKMSVVLSLHEIDLAAKISDQIVCVDGDRVLSAGTPDEIFRGETIRRLYGLEHGDYNLLFGSVEMEKPQGESRVFVLAGGGAGIPAYRALQRRGIPFSTGILSENDVDFQIAQSLSSSVVSVPAFAAVGEKDVAKATEEMKRAGALLLACRQFGETNARAAELIVRAERSGIPVLSSADELTGGESATGKADGASNGKPKERKDAE